MAKSGVVALFSPLSVPVERAAASKARTLRSRSSFSFLRLSQSARVWSCPLLTPNAVLIKTYRPLDHVITILYSSGPPKKRKRPHRTTGNDAINELIFEWFKMARSKNIPTGVSGPIIQLKAVMFARVIGNAEFKASNGWLASFRKSHAI